MRSADSSWVRTIVELAHIGSRPGPVAERAHDAVASLRRLVPFDAHWIALRNPVTGELATLSAAGHDDATIRYLAGPVAAEVSRRGPREDAPVLHVTALPVSGATFASAHLSPAGYVDCTLAALTTLDDHTVGFLSLSTGSVDGFADGRLEALRPLLPLVADAVDPIGDLTAIARQVGDAFAAVLITHEGGTAELHGVPGPGQLTSHSAVIGEAARRLGHPVGSSSFLDPEPAGGGLRVTVLPAPPGTPFGCAGVVVASPPGDIHGLTTRELEILGLLIEGWSNAQIAHQLILAPRTVATHVEHILAKLGVLSRAHAAVLAERDGIYIPHGLRAGADAPGSVDLPMRRRRVRGEGG